MRWNKQILIPQNKTSSQVSISSNPSIGTPWNLSQQRKDRKIWSSIREALENDIQKKTLTLVELEEYLNQLCNITLPNVRIRSDEIAATLVALVIVVPSTSSLLCSEVIRLIQKACLKEKVQISGDQLQVLVDFLISFLRTCPTWYTASTLRALGFLLRENGGNLHMETYQVLLPMLFKYLDPSGVDLEARYAAMTCAAHICMFVGNFEQGMTYFSPLLSIIVENFRQQTLALTSDETMKHPPATTVEEEEEDEVRQVQDHVLDPPRSDRMLVKASTSSLKCLYSIIQCGSEKQILQLRERIEYSLPSLLSSMRSILGFGFTIEADATSSITMQYRPELPSLGSDSSHCVSDGSASSTQTSLAVSDGLLARLRITLLATLESIVLHFPQAITSSLGLYLPEQTTTYMALYQTTPSILTLVLIDPSERARIASAKFLDVLWQKMPLKQYFNHQPTDRYISGSTAFASMPKRISLMLYQVYATLVAAMVKDRKNSAALSQLLKTTACVLQHCPFHNVSSLLNGMKPSLESILQSLLYQVYTALLSTDHGVRTSALSCLSAVFVLPEAVPSVANWLQKSPPLIPTNSNESTLHIAGINVPTSSNRLLRLSPVDDIIAHAHHSDASERTLLRLEAMSLLSKLAKNYSSTLSSSWNSGLLPFFEISFKDVDPNVRLQAIKVLENFVKGNSLERHQQLQKLENEAVPNEIFQNMPECLEFMSKYLIRAFKDTSHHVRASVCTCFTLLSTADWQALERLRAANMANSGCEGPQVPFTRLILQTATDSSPVVRAAGFRLLGSLCLIPFFKTPSFAADVTHIALGAMGDNTLNVRVRAAWALGNVCTTPGPEQQQSCQEVPSQLLYELLPAPLLDELLNKLIFYITDSDKVASSLVRTIGLVARWISYTPFRHQLTTSDAVISNKQFAHWDLLLTQSMEILASKVVRGSPKVKWNSCHAIAKILLCPHLPLASSPWAPAVFEALISAILQQDNFKVRISASSALRVSCSRASYGPFYAPVIEAILSALESASDLRDVAAFKYKEQLETQLSFTMVHLLSLATDDNDYSILWNAILQKPRTFLHDWLVHNLHRMSIAIDKEECPKEEQESQMLSFKLSPSNIDMHDVNPIHRHEILAAISVLLRLLRRKDPKQHTFPLVLSLLYDAKLRLEKEVLDTTDEALPHAFDP